MGALDLAFRARRLRDDLQAARWRIAQLEQQAARRRPVVDMTLRRDTAFYCHPDRGGNVELMARLHALFDTLEVA